VKDCIVVVDVVIALFVSVCTAWQNPYVSVHACVSAAHTGMSKLLDLCVSVYTSVCVCVCVCARARVYLCMCLCVYVYACKSVYSETNEHLHVCMCVRTLSRLHVYLFATTFTKLHKQMYLDTNFCSCMLCKRHPTFTKMPE
jgi:hypothetical protein